MLKAPVIFGFSGTSLTDQEIKLFQEVNPFGFIIFARNIESAGQLRELTNQLRSVSGDENTPILIDQEGGRVARIKPPVYDKLYKPAADFLKDAKGDLDKAVSAVYDNYYDMGLMLKSFGINVNCAPMADLYFDFADKIVGDRSFSSDPHEVTKLCKAVINGLRDAGVIPIIKHLPGHGRAMCDSHLELPTVNESIEDLQNTDFIPFKELANTNVWAMTAHIIFEAIDANNPITISERGIKYLREELGYENNLIMSDDIGMKALNNTMAENSINVLEAGCDIVLHCSGKFEEMVLVSESIKGYSIEADLVSFV